MIRTARFLVTLFVLTLIFDIASHAADKPSAARTLQAPTDPRDDRRQPRQSFETMYKLIRKACIPGPRPDAIHTAGRLPETAPGITVREAASLTDSFSSAEAVRPADRKFWHLFRSCGAESSQCNSFAHYAVKSFGRRRVVKIRYSTALAARVA